MELFEFLLGPIVEVIGEVVIGEIAKVLAATVESLKAVVSELFR